MADRIHASSEWLDKCARDLGSIEHAIEGASRTLSSIRLRRDEGGNLKTSINCRLLMNGGTFSADTAADDIRKLQQAAEALARETARFSGGVRLASQLFEEAEKRADQLIRGLGANGEADIYANGSAADSTVHRYGRAALAFEYVMREWRVPVPECPPAPVPEPEPEAPVQECPPAPVTEPERPPVPVPECPPAPVPEPEPETPPTAVGPGIYDEGLIGEQLYGSNQGRPISELRNDPTGERHEYYREILRESTGREFSDVELENYMTRMNSEGCSYAASVNMIFHSYEGREAEFERTFGFPMYVDGRPNYTRLMVDYYSRTDNYSRDASGRFVYNPYEDYNPSSSANDANVGWANYNIYADTSGKGASAEIQNQRMEKYLSDYGVSYEVKAMPRGSITPENYASYAQDYEVAIGVRGPFYMRNMNGDLVCKSDGGHRMTITGIKDGMYVVSSWGRQYLVSPNDPHGGLDYRLLSINH